MFFAKSAESLENKRLEFLLSAKKHKKMQECGEESELNGDREYEIGDTRLAPERAIP
jgi:hypothetical protein